MLSRLTIVNIALIKRLELEFSPNLNVLSGETGAGKSIIVDGLLLLLGARYDKTLLRFGETSGFVEGVFDVTPAVRPTLAELGLEDDDVLIVTRRFTADGRSEIRVNGRTVAASMLRTMTASLVDIYGQNEYQTLADKAEHLRILDYFVRDKTAEVLPVLAAAYKRYREIVRELSSLGDIAERAQNIDILQYQIDEITAAKIKPGEENALRERRKLIAAAERVCDALGTVANCLTEGDEPTAHTQIGVALKALGSVGDVKDEYAELYDRLKSVSIELADIADTAVNELDGMNFDEHEIDRLEKRYDLITSCKRKYGDYEKMTAFLEDAKARLYKLEHCSELYEQLTAEKAEVLAELGDLCGRLSDIRRAGAIEFAALMKEELSGLGMENCEFEIVFADKPVAETLEKSVSANGFDDAEFYLSPNAGQPLKPLIKIISGGEMSRFMLALKVISSRTDDIPTLIFDEVDAGIGGIVGQAVAKKLARISRAHQVLCVTHLPQIASMADNHYRIAKRVEDGSTVTEVTLLTPEEVIDEISRLSGSKDITATTQATAAEMKAWSDDYKRTIRDAR